VSSHAASPSRALLPRRALALTRPSAGTSTALGVAALLVTVAFAANGGLRLGETTTVELALLLGCGVGGAGAVLATPDRGRWWGMGAAALLLLFAAWTVLSITWAVNPSDAWVEGNRTVTYVAVFAAALALARVAPRQWEGVLAGIVLAAVIVCGYALLTKVFPGTLSSDELYARLRAPFGYWNATGLFAALAIPACVYFGARRHGWGPASALAYPALGLLLVAQLLAYSRGTLLALAIGLIFWFAVVPLRLRGAAVLLGGALGAVPVALWAFAREGLTTDRLPTDLRGPAGHQLGVLLIAMLVLLLLLGLAVTFREARYRMAQPARRRIGTTLVVVLALVPVVFAGSLATTDRGLFGSISHGWTTLTDPQAATPPNDPSRLTAIGSVRSRYWNEALKTWQDNPWIGVGAEGYATVRPFYRQDTLEVRHAHGFAVQTLADLGLVGIALALAILAAWAAAAARATGLRRRDRGRPYPPERIGLLTMAAIVVVFGVHSFIDWTWFVPGCTVIALLCAGWVAGRGPIDAAATAQPPLRGPRAWLRERGAMVAAVGIVAAAVVVAWAVWQPLRSLNASNDALAALEAGDVARAQSLARDAHDINPVSLEPLSVLAVAQARAKDNDAALATLRREVELQPANPEPWVRLADFQFNRLKEPEAALDSLENAVYLDPRNPQTLGAYLIVYRATRGAK
jgi:tetratricopeptide (TPR) repeat protein